MKNIACIRPAAVVLLIACGGGGGGPPAPPTIQLTSHIDGQVVANGNRSITLSGTGARMRSVEVKVNGTALPPSAVTSTATTFSASVTLGNNANTIEAVATNASGNASSGVVTVSYPFLTFTIFQGASRVIGQADFSAHFGNRLGAPAANTTNAFSTVIVCASMRWGPPEWHVFASTTHTYPEMTPSSPSLPAQVPVFTH